MIRNKINPRDLLEMYLTPEHAKEFAKWAFGDKYLTMDWGEEAVSVWNERHGDKLTLEQSGKILEDLQKMIKIWTKST